MFEDLAPRLVRMAPGEPVELLTIVSRRQDGAGLVLMRLDGDRLDISAQTPPVGMPMRWLNPVGVADLDGDGQAEVAIVSTPHIGGVLRAFRCDGRQLVEAASMAGFSNRVYGSTELALSVHHRRPGNATGRCISPSQRDRRAGRGPGAGPSAHPHPARVCRPSGLIERFEARGMLAFKHSGFSLNASICIQSPRIAPARGPPLWDACDAQGADGAGQGAPIDSDWGESAQTTPEDVFDQRTEW